jgi:uncharacterized protein YciI
MFVIFLKFSDNKGNAGKFMEAHNSWIKNGIKDGIFLVVGSLQPSLGGGIIAHNVTLEDLQHRVNEDPFIAENVVTAEIHEISPAMTDERLNFLME